MLLSGMCLKAPPSGSLALFSWSSQVQEEGSQGQGEASELARGDPSAPGRPGGSPGDASRRGQRSIRRKKGPAADPWWGHSKEDDGHQTACPLGTPGKGSKFGCGPHPCCLSHLLPQKRLASPSWPEPPSWLGNLGWGAERGKGLSRLEERLCRRPVCLSS